MTEVMDSSPVMVYKIRGGGWTDMAAREKNTMQGQGSEGPCPPARAPSRKKNEDEIQFARAAQFSWFTYQHSPKRTQLEDCAVLVLQS